MLGLHVIFVIALAVAQVQAKFLARENLPLLEDINPDHVEHVQGHGDSRIVGGWLASPGQFPSFVALRTVHRNGDAGVCGGSLIARHWVLTAAVCTSLRAYIVVRGGVVDMARPEFIRETTEWFQHPSFRENNNNNIQANSIALIKLQRVTYTRLTQPIRLQPRQNAFANYNNIHLIAAGFGATRADGPVVERLLWVSQRGISNQRCNLAIWTNYFNSNSMCVQGFDSSSQTICRGDIGGPLIRFPNNGVPYLVGVAYFYRNNCQATAPTGYLRVGAFHNWYTQITGLNFENLVEEPETEAPPTEPPSTTTVSTQAPEIDSEKDPEIDTEEPEIDIDEPEVDTEDPEIDTEEPEIDTEDPEIDTEEPEIDTEEPEINTELPEIDTEKPEIDTEEPEIDTEDPEIDTEEPEIDTEEPEIDTEDPDIDTEEPEIDTTQEPDVETEIPTSTTQEPEYEAEIPTSTTQEPEYEAEIPTSTTQEPEFETEIPSSTTQEPEYETEIPTSTTQEPEFETDIPTSTTQEPEFETEIPTSTTQEPEIDTEDNIATTQAPETTTLAHTTTPKPDENEDSDSSESSEEDNDPELNDLLKSLKVLVKVKVRMTKHGKKIEHSNKHKKTITHR